MRINLTKCSMSRSHFLQLFSSLVVVGLFLLFNSVTTTPLWSREVSIRLSCLLCDIVTKNWRSGSSVNKWVNMKQWNLISHSSNEFIMRSFHFHIHDYIRYTQHISSPASLTFNFNFNHCELWITFVRLQLRRYSNNSYSFQCHDMPTMVNSSHSDERKTRVKGMMRFLIKLWRRYVVM